MVSVERGAALDRGSQTGFLSGAPGKLAEAGYFVGPLVLDNPQPRNPGSRLGPGRVTRVHAAVR